MIEAIRKEYERERKRSEQLESELLKLTFENRNLRTSKGANNMHTVAINVKRTHPEAKLPAYKTDGAAGFDLHSIEGAILSPGEMKSFKLGLAFEIPEGYEIQIRPRSGLSFDTGLIAKNTIGTIDSDYRGEIAMCLMNIGLEPEEINPGDRICQGILKEVPKAKFYEVKELSDSKRGEAGFGSTGK